MGCVFWGIFVLGRVKNEPPRGGAWNVRDRTIFGLFIQFFRVAYFLWFCSIWSLSVDCRVSSFAACWPLEFFPADHFRSPKIRLFSSSFTVFPLFFPLQIFFVARRPSLSLFNYFSSFACFFVYFCFLPFSQPFWYVTKPFCSELLRKPVKIR